MGSRRDNAEIGVMHLQDQWCQGLLTNPRNERKKESFNTTPGSERSTANSVIAHFQPPEVRE